MFGNLSEGGLPVFSLRCQGKSASGMVRSEDLRVIYCMASRTLVDYFVYWSLAHPMIIALFAASLIIIPMISSTVS
jgi:hypothetical protein